MHNVTYLFVTNEDGHPDLPDRQTDWRGTGKISSTCSLCKLISSYKIAMVDLIILKYTQMG